MEWEDVQQKLASPLLLPPPHLSPLAPLQSLGAGGVVAAAAGPALAAAQHHHAAFHAVSDDSAPCALPLRARGAVGACFR